MTKDKLKDLAEEILSTPKLKGFAALKARDPGKMTEIARKGGLSVPNDKRPFSQNPELAASAGKKGGETSKRKPK